MDLDKHHIISVSDEKLCNLYSVVKCSKEYYTKPDGFQTECSFNLAIFNEEIKQILSLMQLCTCTTERERGESILFYLLTALRNGGHAGYDVTVVPNAPNVFCSSLK